MGDDGVEHVDERDRRGDAVGRGIDADHRVAAAVHEAVDDAGRDPARVVGRMVGLKPRGQSPLEPDGVAEPGHHPALLRHQDQVLNPHDLGHRRRHLGCQAGCEGGEGRFVRRVRQQQVAEVAHREMRDGRESGRIVPVDDEPRHFVLLVGNQRLAEERPERHFGQGHLRDNALLVVFRGDSGQSVARARRAGSGHQVLEAAKPVRTAADGA